MRVQYEIRRGTNRGGGSLLLTVFLLQLDDTGVGDVRDLREGRFNDL